MMKGLLIFLGLTIVLTGCTSNSPVNTVSEAASETVQSDETKTTDDEGVITKEELQPADSEVLDTISTDPLVEEQQQEQKDYEYISDISWFIGQSYSDIKDMVQESREFRDPYEDENRVFTWLCGPGVYPEGINLMGLSMEYGRTDQIIHRLTLDLSYRGKYDPYFTLCGATLTDGYESIMSTLEKDGWCVVEEYTEPPTEGNYIDKMTYTMYSRKLQKENLFVELTAYVLDDNGTIEERAIGQNIYINCYDVTMIEK